MLAGGSSLGLASGVGVARAALHAAVRLRRAVSGGASGVRGAKLGACIGGRSRGTGGGGAGRLCYSAASCKSCAGMCSRLQPPAG